MRSVTRHLRSIVTTAALVAGLAVPGVLGATAASAGPAVACPYDRPCINKFFYAPSTGRLNATWTGENYDVYNVRWTVNRGGRVVSFGQHEVHGRVAKLAVRQGDRIHPFTVSVQGCNTGFLSSSTCTKWHSVTITPTPGAR